jgi:hypothetical protein
MPKFSSAVTAEAGRLLGQPAGAVTRDAPFCTRPVRLFQAALTRGAPVPRSSAPVAARGKVISCRILSSQSLVMSRSVFRDATQCSKLKGKRRFGGTNRAGGERDNTCHLLSGWFFQTLFFESGNGSDVFVRNVM